MTGKTKDGDTVDDRDDLCGADGGRPAGDMLPGEMPAGPCDIGFADLQVPDDVRGAFDAAVADRATTATAPALGRVIRLDRTLPLVCTPAGNFRAEHAASLVKGSDTLSAVGDWVVLDLPAGHDNAVVTRILPRKNLLSRPDPKRKGGRQVLAANIDIVFIMTPFSPRGIDLGHLERQLVLAYQSHAEPVILLSKADIVDPALCRQQIDEVARIAFEVPVVAESAEQGLGIARIAQLIPRGRTAALLGKSGVGKSTLVNALVGAQLQLTGEVRQSDGRGRHTTIARRMVALPGGGLLIDAPGLRSFSLTGSAQGVARAFPDIGRLAQRCRFRDCGHVHEPGCAVRDACEQGLLSQRRLRSYLDIAAEVAGTGARR